MDALEKIRGQRERIDKINNRRNAISGEIAQLDRQVKEGMNRLKTEFEVESLEEAEKKIEELRVSARTDEEKVDTLLDQAEAILKGQS